MFCTTSGTVGDVGNVKHVKAPELFITDRSKAVVLSRFSVSCFCVRVLVTFHLMCAHIIFSLVWEWPPLKKASHSVDHMLSLYFDYS